MRRSQRRAQFLQQDPFTDLLFNALLGFVFLFLMSVLLINPPAEQGKIDPKAEYILTITWPEESPDDVDTWVESPSGEVLWFRQPAVGLMHLDRDDRGMANDQIVVNGQSLRNPLNQEVITLRGVEPGEYTVNLHYYQSHSRNAIDVQVQLAKVNPSLQVAYYGSTHLPRAGSEKTALRFSIDSRGEVSQINTLQKAVVRHDLLR